MRSSEPVTPPEEGSGLGKKRIWLIAGGAAVLVALVVVSIVAASHRGSAARVYAEAAEHRDITRIVKASGQIDPRTKVNISAHVIGKIQKLYVKEGDWIETGKPFLDLEKEAFVALRDSTAAQLEIQRSRLRQAEISLADAKVKLARAQRLINDQIASREQFEAAELNHNSALQGLEQGKEGVAQARADYEKAKSDLDKTTIYAPITGRVIALNAKEGEVVVSGTMNNPASVIGTIADLSEILAEVDTDETEVVYVQLGQRATVDVDAIPDHPYEGKVVELGSSGYAKPTQPDVTFFKVKVLLDAPDQKLRPGMSARASIHTATSAGAIVVPIQAVVERKPVGAKPSASAKEVPEVKVVFVVDHGKAVQKPVKTGLADTTGIEITSGLAGGEQVVTGPYRSLKKLKDADPVTVGKESEDVEAEKSGST